jgi:hypothetical protein
LQRIYESVFNRWLKSINADGEIFHDLLDPFLDLIRREDQGTRNIIAAFDPLDGGVKACKPLNSHLSDQPEGNQP